MVALAIIGLAMGAVLELATQSTRSSVHLTEKTAALWIASNLTVEAELAGILPSSEQRGIAPMFGKQWHWIQTVENTRSPGLKRLRTRVFSELPKFVDGEGAHADLSAFIGRKQ
jgi:type II secretion system protein I